MKIVNIKSTKAGGQCGEKVSHSDAICPLFLTLCILASLLPVDDSYDDDTPCIILLVNITIDQ